MKIFIGMNNVASLIGDYTEGFKDLGCEVFSVTRTDHAITSNNVDLNIPVLVNGKMKRENDFSPQAKEKWTKFYNEMAWQKALEADVVFFLWSSFMEDCSDLPLLKKLGKKIIVRFAGSEVRYPPFEREFCKWSGFPYGDNNLREDIDGFKKKLHYIRMVELFADVVIGSAALSLRPSFVNGFGLFSKRDIPQRTVHNEIPIIMHAPSKRLTKGTNDWLVVFDALRANGFKFGLKIIEGIPHEQMLREYSSADIFCNSLIYSGRTAMEAMAAGCVVLDVGQPCEPRKIPA
jgi:glycosyltransferase involved in cell wall biosynthesis